jgi:hypothetical protein
MTISFDRVLLGDQVRKYRQKLKLMAQSESASQNIRPASRCPPSLQKPPIALSSGVYPQAIVGTNPQKLDHRVLNNRLAFRDFHRFEVRGVYLSRKNFCVISPVPIKSISYHSKWLTASGTVKLHFGSSRR